MSALVFQFDPVAISYKYAYIPQPHDLPFRWGDAEAAHVAPLAMPARDAEREQVVQQSVTQSLGGGDGRLGALDGLVDSVEDGGDASLLGKGWEEEGLLLQACPSNRWHRTNIGKLKQIYRFEPPIQKSAITFPFV